MIDLNNLDVERFAVDEEYQDAVRSSEAGQQMEILATSMTLQDCGEFLAFAAPELLTKFFRWADKNYPELDIDPEEAERMVKEAIQAGEIGIKKP